MAEQTLPPEGWAYEYYVCWRTEVGFLNPWDAEFFVILGQIGFYDQFTITMNRRALTVLVQDVETPLGR